MSVYKTVFDRNMYRVKSLCALYNSLKTNEAKESKEYKFTDILRSAIVFLHSSFEEYFRNVLRDVLPNTCTQEDLKKISFTTKDGRHIDKLTVGNLLQYKGKTVDDLVAGFIGDTLDTTSFNNYVDIVSWAKKINVDLSTFTSQEKIEKMIMRRHKIVNEADNSRTDKMNNSYSLTVIFESVVNEWINAVQNLVNIIDSQIEGEINNVSIQV